MYNGEKYIEGCLKSIVSQNVSSQRCEIIVINDGSTDGGPKIVSEFSRKYSNISLVNQQNAGLSAARNKGMDVACGQYIFFVDADDEVKVNALAPLFEILQNEQFDILSFGVNGKSEDFSIKDRDSGVNIFTKYSLFNGVWSYIFSRSYIEECQARFITGMLSEDIAFVFDTFLRAQKVLRIEATVYCNIKRPNSITTSKERKHLLLYVEKLQALVFYLTDAINTHRNVMTEQNLRAFCRRRDLFIMILFVRAMRVKLSDKQILKIINELKDRQLYPYKRVNNSITYRLLTFVFNRPILFRLAASIYRTIA
jgi:glycosyltransferase involved in cell wall biosynthesis